MKKYSLVSTCLAILSLMAVSTSAQSLPTIPDSLQGKTISVVVPYGPGGNSDIVARQLAQQVTLQTGIKTIVINKPGASGSIAASFVAASKPDGLTLCQCETGPAFFNEIVGLPGSPKKDDLIPISGSIEGILAIAVSGTSDIHTIKELVEYLRSHQDTTSFASTGSISLAWTEEFLSVAKVQGVQSILYKSQAETIASVMGGVTNFLIGGIGDMVKLSEAGKLRILAVGYEKRVPVIPQVPTMREAFAPIVYTNLNGIYAPKGTPADLQLFLNKTWSNAVWSASTISFLHSRGIIPVGGDLPQAKSIHNLYYKSRQNLYVKYRSQIDGK